MKKILCDYSVYFKVLVVFRCFFFIYISNFFLVEIYDFCWRVERVKGFCKVYIVFEGLMLKINVIVGIEFE